MASYEIKVAAAALAMCLIGITASVHRASSTLFENARWVAHTHEVLSQLEATARDLAEVETDLKGLLFTGRRSYLQPYSKGLADTRSRLKTVRRLTADNAHQQARLNLLEPLVLDRLEQLDALRRFGKEEKFAAAQRVMDGDRASQYLTEIRQIIQEMELEEQELLSARFSQQEASTRRLQKAVYLSCGAALFLLFLSLAIVLHDLSTVQAAFETARYHVAHDTLTELASRRSLMAHLDHAIANAVRNGAPLSVCLCDIDRFKAINDTHGHNSGDEVLAAFGRLLSGGIRKGDIAGRLGGDEFCILLPDTAANEAGQLVERVREEWEATKYYSSDGRVFSVTASFGVVQLNGERTAKALLHTADRALYRAKDEGRNRMYLVA